jgi:hypothetical protein
MVSVDMVTKESVRRPSLNQGLLRTECLCPSTLKHRNPNPNSAVLRGGAFGSDHVMKLTGLVPL